MNGIEELLVTFFYRSRIKINHGYIWLARFSRCTAGVIIKSDPINFVVCSYLL
jgi:hypothetical protein